MVPLSDIVDLSHLDDRDVIVYETEEDAAGIYIEQVHPYPEKLLQTHFKHAHIYRIEPHCGSFNISERRKTEYLESYTLSLKCWRELFKLLEEYQEECTEFELYTCWADEEDHERNKELDAVIRLSTFELEQADFELLEKQYVRIELN